MPQAHPPGLAGPLVSWSLPILTAEWPFNVRYFQGRPGTRLNDIITFIDNDIIIKTFSGAI